MSNEQSRSNSNQITYIGVDHLFFKDFKENIIKLSKDSNTSVNFKRINVPDGSFPKIFKDLWESPPGLIIFDFASYSSDGDERYNFLIGLSTLIRQNSRMKNCTLIAVYDYLVKDEVIEQVLMNGIRYNFIKSSENDILPNTTFSIIKTVELPEFLIAIPEEPIEGVIKQTMRIGYLTKDFFRIETNSNFNINQEVELIDHPLDFKGPIKCTVSEPEEGALYYHLKKAYYLKFLTEQGLKTSHSIKHLNDKYKPKWVRTFIYDPKLEFIDDDLPLLSSLPFTLRIETDLNECIKKIKTFQPHIVVTQAAKAEDVESIKRESAAQTILLQFASKSGETLSSSEDLSFEYVLEIFKTFQDKNPFNKKGKIFFSNNDPKVITSIRHVVEIKGFNENMIFFNCPTNLTEGIVLKMSHPFNALITLIQNEETDEKLKDCYCGILNLMSEAQVRKIRQQFHYIFTAEAREKRLNDVMELQEKNKEFLVQKEKERREKERKEAEEREKEEREKKGIENKTEEKTEE